MNVHHIIYVLVQVHSSHAGPFPVLYACSNVFEKLGRMGWHGYEAQLTIITMHSYRKTLTNKYMTVHVCTHVKLPCMYAEVSIS